MIRQIINKLPMSVRDKYRPTWNNLQFDTRIAMGKIYRLFRRPPLPENADGSVNLHLGCGSIDHPMFINIDAIPAKHVHYVQQIDRLDQFKDCSVDLIYACHCLEHFSHRDISRVLKEWHRVLKNGGILRLSVPDFDSMVNLYIASGHDIKYVLGPITGGQDYKYNYHKTIFNTKSLEELLYLADFSEVRLWQPGSDMMTTFKDWSSFCITFGDRSFPVSLNLDAVK